MTIIRRIRRRRRIYNPGAYTSQQHYVLVLVHAPLDQNSYSNNGCLIKHHKTNVCIEQQNEYVCIATLGYPATVLFAIQYIHRDAVIHQMTMTYPTRDSSSQVMRFETRCPHIGLICNTDCRITDLYVWVIEALY